MTIRKTTDPEQNGEVQRGSMETDDFIENYFICN